ncbi:hypothetical protein QTG54_002853 [Skeletonema marinoi]|uniref:Uncharacterized protein n=1 Tax=Skeletonema marinoi TaxID=267567 RepID=A0AAD9DFX5_9STRA|nr:hypothetical protein QTG54_002853 [Skeletonema marinoi]
MNNEEVEQCVVIAGEEDPFLSGGDEEQGNKRKHSGEEEEDEAGDEEGPDQKKRKSGGYAVQRGLCVAHGAVVKKYPRKRCVVEGCDNIARGKMAKCVGHGGTPCNKFAQRGGTCIKHGKELAAARAQAAAIENGAAVAAPPPVAVAPPPAIPPAAVAPPPAIPPVAALPPFDVNNDNDDTENAELSQILCSEIVNDQDSLVSSVDNNNNGVMEDSNVEPPSVAVAAMPETVTTTNKISKKKRARKRCIVEGCNKIGRGKSAKCVAHGGTPVKKCSFEGCQNNQKQGGRCKRHGAKLNEKPKICIFLIAIIYIGPNLPGAREYKIARKDDGDAAVVDYVCMLITSYIAFRWLDVKRAKCSLILFLSHRYLPLVASMITQAQIFSIRDLISIPDEVDGREKKKTLPSGKDPNWSSLVMTPKEVCNKESTICDWFGH